MALVILWTRVPTLENLSRIFSLNSLFRFWRAASSPFEDFWSFRVISLLKCSSCLRATLARLCLFSLTLRTSFLSGRGICFCERIFLKCSSWVFWSWSCLLLSWWNRSPYKAYAFPSLGFGAGFPGTFVLRAWPPSTDGSFPFSSAAASSSSLAFGALRFGFLIISTLGHVFQVQVLPLQLPIPQDVQFPSRGLVLCNPRLLQTLDFLQSPRPSQMFPDFFQGNARQKLPEKGDFFFKDASITSN